MTATVLGARFTMSAEVLKWHGITEPTPKDASQDSWETFQDPITGEVRNNWVPTTAVIDDPLTDANEYRPVTIDCIARGIVSNGIRGAGTSEIFGANYENMEYVQMWVPAKTIITKRDRITNIRFKKNGQVVWIDEEYLDGLRPTIFNVNGVTPQFDAFNRHVQNFVMLEKADANDSG